MPAGSGNCAQEPHGDQRFEVHESQNLKTSSHTISDDEITNLTNPDSSQRLTHDVPEPQS